LNAAAFDALAGGYDDSFTDTPCGTALRRMVWSRTDRAFAGAQRVLDLGCGTGEDAVHLAWTGARILAVDASSAMVDVAREKAKHNGFADRIDVRCMPIESVAQQLTGQRFDAVLSNFGALNCVADLPALAQGLSRMLLPGGALIWVLMGRYVPWEWLWYLLRADPHRATRRLRGLTRWRGIEVRYPSPQSVSQALQPFFVVSAVRPLGFLFPPSYAANWLNRRPRVLQALARLEVLLGQDSPALAAFADHYVIEARCRRPADAAAAA
jgi:ubiquinone/menaquinone biosynthesis C-methylase UbiE